MIWSILALLCWGAAWIVGQWALQLVVGLFVEWREKRRG